MIGMLLRNALIMKYFAKFIWLSKVQLDSTGEKSDWNPGVLVGGAP